MDGSAKEVGTVISTGGAAVVYKDEAGEWQSVSWSPPREEVPRESGAMEVLALLMALRQLESGGRYVIWTDCQMVVKGWNSMHQRLREGWWSEGAGKYDGLWRCIEEEWCKLEGGGTQAELRKIKAHRTKNEVAIGEEDGTAEHKIELERWEGNRRADVAAKEASARGAFTRLQQDDVEEVREVVEYLAQNWSRLLNNSEEGIGLKGGEVAGWKENSRRTTKAKAAIRRARRDKEKKQEQTERGHRVRQYGFSKFRCERCLGSFVCMPDRKVCKGTPLGVTKAVGLQESTGHKLVLAMLADKGGGEGAGGPIVYCRCCGKYTTRNCKGLKDKCTGNTETRKAWLLRLGKDKKHPTNQDLVVTHEWDVSSLKADWERTHKNGEEADKLHWIMGTTRPCRVEADEKFVSGAKVKTGGEVQVTVLPIQEEAEDHYEDWEDDISLSGGYGSLAGGYDAEWGLRFAAASPVRGVG